MRQLLRNSRTARVMSPVFIVGEARSGTSILYRTLQKHPSFAPREPNLVETELFALLRRAFLFRRTSPAPLLAFMLGDEDEYRAFLRSIRPARLASLAAAPVNAVLRDPPLWWWRATLAHLVARSYVVHATAARRCRRLVEKTPSNVVHLDRLRVAFPSGRFLYIHRHPVDVLSSYRRRAQVDPGARWAEMEAPAFCRRYAERTARALAWRADHPGSLALLAYEHLTTDPRSALGAVCSFLDEPFDDRMLDEPAPRPGRWPVDPHLWGPIAAETKRWQDHLDAGEAATVQHTLADTMGALGYQPYR